MKKISNCKNMELFRICTVDEKAANNLRFIFTSHLDIMLISRLRKLVNYVLRWVRDRFHKHSAIESPRRIKLSRVVGDHSGTSRSSCESPGNAQLPYLKRRCRFLLLNSTFVAWTSDKFLH